MIVARQRGICNSCSGLIAIILAGDAGARTERIMVRPGVDG